MKFLLINAFHSPEATAGYYKRFLAPMPPITQAYLAAVLEQAGVDVTFYDDALAGGNRAALSRILRSKKPDIVGLSPVTAAMPGVERVARMVRSVSPESTIVMGNIHADIFYSEILSHGLADIIVHGEGEITVVELCEALAKKNPDLEKVKGISFLRDKRVVTTEVRPYIENLDDLPFPAWHLFPIEKYKIFNFARVKEPGALILGSRGCPFRCTYCSLKIMGNARRRRSPQNIADEIEYLHDRFGYVQASFIDPIFPLSKKEGVAFARELMGRGLHKKLIWVTETRTDLVDQELLGALAESGLRRIMFGFEAGDPEQLKKICKGAKFDAGFEAAAAARSAGLEIIGFFMLGITGETTQTMQATIDYAQALDVDFAKFTIFVPFPGTAVYYDLLKQGKIDSPGIWQRYTSYPTKKIPSIYVPDGLTNAQMIAYQRKAYASFYLRPKMAYRHLVQIKALTLRDAYDGIRTIFTPGTN
jgi:radical SAM superfamily enzyme YgiQ (UPF0313 family)